MKTDKIPARLRGMFAGQPQLVQMLAVAVLADKTPEQLAQILDILGDPTPDWTRPIPGTEPAPGREPLNLRQFNGKTRQQLKREGHSDETLAKVDEVLAEYKDANGEPLRLAEETQPGEPPAMTRAGDVGQNSGMPVNPGAVPLQTFQPGGGLPETVVGGPYHGRPADEVRREMADQANESQRTAAARSGTVRTEQGTEPVFAGQPLSFFRNMSREEMLEVEGVGEATADKIDEALAANPPPAPVTAKGGGRKGTTNPNPLLGEGE